MMPARRDSTHLRDRLPEARGRYETDAPLAGYSWFRVGGPAEVLYHPADAEDLAHFLSACPPHVALTVIGVGSNLLVRDGGVEGVVIRLGKAFSRIKVEGTRLRVGAGALDITVANKARDHGLAGLEFLRGVPGSIGGAVAMNAGAYGREMADVLVEATILDRAGERHVLPAADLGFAYRQAALPQGSVVIEAVLAGAPGDGAAIQAEMDRIAAAREESQPLRTRTGGSTFKNPPGHKAWVLIDQAGGRGLSRGGAQVSPKHCNFLINTGAARAADLEALGEELRQRVKQKTGIDLEWEIRRIGRPQGARR
jgi:UDP-N-acetylmuramate dehydrogenase